MRRLFSMVLTVVVALPMLAALLSLGPGQPLPLCCRRGGAHRCMEMAAAPTGRPQLRAVCPAFPRQPTSLQTGVWSLPGVAATSAHGVQQPSAVGQVEAGYRVSSLRSRQKRGPPSFLL